MPGPNDILRKLTVGQLKRMYKFAPNAIKGDTAHFEEYVVTELCPLASCVASKGNSAEAANKRINGLFKKLEDAELFYEWWDQPKTTVKQLQHRINTVLKQRGENV